MTEMNLQEIAAGLNISLATVKRHLIKAMSSVKKAVLRDDGLRASLVGIASTNLSGGNA